MAQFAIEIADADVMKVLLAMAGMYGWQATVANPSFNPDEPESESNPATIANPETIAMHANRKVREFLSENVVAWEVRKAEAAIAAARASAVVTIVDPQS